MARWELFGTVGKKIAALLQKKTITSMELLQEWMDLATEEGDTDAQRRLLQLMRNETERAEIHQRWQEGDESYLLERVYPQITMLPKRQEREAKNGTG